MIKKYKDFLLLEKFNKNLFLKEWDELQNIPGWNAKVDNSGNIDPDAIYLNQRLFNPIKRTMEMFRQDFSKKIKALGEYFEGYYTNLASNISANPENDFKEMQSFIDKSGFTLEIISKLFDKKVCQLLYEDYSSFIDKNHLDEINGYIDVYLYFINEKLKLSSKSIDLGGSSRVNIMLDGESDNLDDNVLMEWTIKYAYGYHKTPYGQLFIKQLGLTPQQFIKEVFQKIHKNCFESFMMDSIPVDFGDINEILEEVKEDGGLIEQNGNTFKIYLEAFWIIISRFLKEKQSYDEFKQIFISWLENVTKAQVEDDGMTVQFNLLDN